MIARDICKELSNDKLGFNISYDDEIKSESGPKPMTIKRLQSMGQAFIPSACMLFS